MAYSPCPTSRLTYAKLLDISILPPVCFRNVFFYHPHLLFENLVRLVFDLRIFFHVNLCVPHVSEPPVAHQLTGTVRVIMTQPVSMGGREGGREGGKGVM